MQNMRQGKTAKRNGVVQVDWGSLLHSAHTTSAEPPNIVPPYVRFLVPHKYEFNEAPLLEEALAFVNTISVMLVCGAHPFSSCKKASCCCLDSGHCNE